jgi:hypothetical protein
LRVTIDKNNKFYKIIKINEFHSPNISANIIDNGTNEILLIDIKNGIIRLTNKINKTIIDTICEPKNFYSKIEQQKQGVVISASYEDKVKRSAVQCTKAGYKRETDEQTEKFWDCLSYVFAIYEERELARKLQKEKIKLVSKYESKSGEEINRESKWTKFWKGVGWVLHEHGDEILAVILDVKYGTNHSGYNENKTVSHSGKLRCTSQRLSNVIHQNCKGQGVHIYCMYQKVSSTQWRRTCREK